MASLYVLAEEYKALADMLTDAELNPQVIADTLEGAAGELEVKATNVAMFVRNLEANAEAIKQAEKDMAARRKALEAKAEHIRRYLKENMQRCGITKIESPYFILSLAKNPPAVVIDDMNAIPIEYMIAPPAPPAAPDKKAIAQALKDGYTVDGAHLEHGERLVIK